MKKKDTRKRKTVGRIPPPFLIKTVGQSHADFLVDFRTRYQRNLDTGCWEWKSANRSGAYGTIVHGGRLVVATRYSYENFIGPVPKGMIMCHKCDNPRCVNPGHLFPGTDADNCRDKVSKKRHAFGERSPRAKLKADQVVKIREMVASGMSNAEVGRVFGLARQRVSDIALRKYWESVA